MGKISTREYIYYGVSERKAAERLIARCGIQAGLKGFDYLADAAVLYGLKGCCNLGDVYARIASMHGTDCKSVMHDIEYAIAANPDAVRKMGALLGMRTTSEDIRNGFVITTLGRLLAHAYVKVYA